jgi:2-oxoglutarate ferredoxin oxidoreductase subunit alpha
VNDIAPSVATPGQEVRERVVIRFAGDSGDGIQLTGTQFTNTSALLGNDVATLPDYPAEIRAPAGTLFGVSGFQLQFGSTEVLTPGDQADALVAFNPAALKTNLPKVRDGGMLIVNSAAFTTRNLEKAGYSENPLEDGSLEGHQLISVDMTTLVRNALKETGLSTKAKDRAKNLFALGMVYHLYERTMDHTIGWLEKRFGAGSELAEANVLALKAGNHFAENVGYFRSTYRVEAAPIAAGRYRNLIGSHALAMGMVAATRRAGIPLFLGSYPITPASDILHSLARMRAHDVRTLQAEDEIAAACAAVGASYAGSLGVCTTSGPGLALKGETIGLATMVELPMLIVDAQRGGPSTGLPTKTEQSDLNIALFGRNGEAPLPVLAARSPADCFWTAFEAARITIEWRTPVVLLSDGYVGNGSEPWRIPNSEELPAVQADFLTEVEGEVLPYQRDPETLIRPWILPGTPGLEHRVGGLEKDALTGNVSYDADNHHRMCELRRDKVLAMQREIPPTEILGEERGKLLVVGWGSTHGAITVGTRLALAEGLSVAAIHLRWLNPLPPDLGEILSRFERVLVPEMNLGQLRNLLRSEYLVDAVGLNQVTGQPFTQTAIYNAIRAQLGATS